MPTGYTADIAKGITFPAFALQCARAFGACIEMRDDPPDKPIPDEFKPSDYHSKQLQAALRRKAEIEKMDAIKCGENAQKEHEQSRSFHQNAIIESDALKAKYDDMLTKVKKWKSPSVHHQGLKKFMIEQIIKSIKFDCGGTYHQDCLAKIKLLNPEQWKAAQLKKIKWDINYHKNGQREENERVLGLTKWVRQLKGSLITE